MNQKRAMRAVLLLSVATAFGGAWAQDDEGGGASHSGGWAVQSGQTVGSGNTVLHGQMGFPGISATLLHGLNRQVDLGGRFSFNYGYEGQATSIAPGLKLQFVLRFGVLQRGKFNFGLRAEPGFFAYFRSGYTMFGLAVPVGADFGIRVSDALSINLNVDLPMFAAFPSYGGGGTFVVPILFGAGAEYRIDQSLALTVDTRFGPAIASTGSANFAFNLLFGLAYKF